MKKALAILGLLAILTALVPMAAEAGGRHHHGFHRGGRVFVGVGVGCPKETINWGPACWVVSRDANHAWFAPVGWPPEMCRRR